MQQSNELRGRIAFLADQCEFARIAFVMANQQELIDALSILAAAAKDIAEAVKQQKL